MARNRIDVPVPMANPLIVSIVFNTTMKAWDVEMVIGGFADEEQARSVAEHVGKVMNAAFGANLGRVDVTNEGGGLQ